MTFSSSAEWATKFFEPSLAHQKLSINEVARLLSQSDGCPKTIRELASKWADSAGTPAITTKQTTDREFIESVYGTYSSMVDSHRRDISKLAELRARSNGSFTAYLKLIRSSALRSPIQNIANSALEGLNKIDADTFLDDILTLGRGASLKPQAELLVGVWKDSKYAIAHATDAARALRRHTFLALYRDDNGSAGIETNAVDEEELFALFCEKYSAEKGDLKPFLAPLVEIVCSLRGYKANVAHVTVLQAGSAAFPNSKEVA